MNGESVTAQLAAFRKTRPRTSTLDNVSGNLSTRPANPGRNPAMH